MSDKYIRQENIKDCPFCGCSVSVERVPLKHYQGCVIFEIKCLNCGCERTLTKNDSVYRTEEEARANAIAQWNERSYLADVVPVVRCKDCVHAEHGEHNICLCERYDLVVDGVFFCADGDRRWHNENS